jgi:integrase
MISIQALIEAILASEKSKKKTGIPKKYKEQLVCASQLVYYCGLKKQELPKLTVRDVLGRDGEIVASIVKFGKRKPIRITEEAREALRAYLKMEKPEERDFRLRKRFSPLFPSYRTGQHLYHDWAVVGARHQFILVAGIDAFLSSHSVEDTAKHFRYKRNRSIHDKASGRPKRVRDIFSRSLKY